MRIIINNRYLRWGLLIFIYLIVVIPFINGDFSGEEFRDLLAYHDAGNGKVIYRDFTWPYGPLGPYLFGLFYHFLEFPISILILRLLVTLIGIISVLVADSVFGKMVRQPWAMIASLFVIPLYIAGQYTYNNGWVVLFSLLGFYMIFNYLEREQTFYNPYLVGSGLAFAALVLVRPIIEGPLFVLGITCYLWLLRQRIAKWSWSWFLCWSCLPVIMSYGILYLLALGHVDFWEKVLIPLYGQASVSYSSFFVFDLSWFRSLTNVSWHSLSVIYLGVQDTWERLVVFIFIFSGFLILWLLRKNEKEHNFKLCYHYYLLFHLAVIIGSLRLFYSGNRYPYLLVFPQAGMVVLFGYLMDYWRTRARIRKTVVVSFIALFMLNLPLKSYLDMTWFNLSRIMPMPKSHKAYFIYQTPGIKGLVAGLEGRRKMIDDAITAIRNNTESKDEIYCFGYESLFYVLAERKSIFPENEYSVLSAGLCDRRNKDKQLTFVNLKPQAEWIKNILERMLKEKPVIIITASERFVAGLTDKNPAFDYIRTHYDPLQRFGYESYFINKKHQDAVEKCGEWIQLYKRKAGLPD